MKKQARCLEAKKLFRIAKKSVILLHANKARAKSNFDLTFFLQSFQYQSELQSIPSSIMNL